MSTNLKSKFFLKKILLYILILSLTTGAFIFFSPLMKSFYSVEADITSHHSDNHETSIDLNNRIFFVHENTVYPQSALRIEPRISAVIVEENNPLIKEYEVLRIVNTTLTGYSSTVDQTNCQPFITASGAWVRDGIVAANFLPFGTQIRIPRYFGDKVFVVKDRMNQRHNDRVDIWFLTRQEAINFGVKNTYIEVVQEI